MLCRKIFEKILLDAAKEKMEYQFSQCLYASTQTGNRVTLRIETIGCSSNECFNQSPFHIDVIFEDCHPDGE
jgi:hypothetical protein